MFAVSHWFFSFSPLKIVFIHCDRQARAPPSTPQDRSVTAFLFFFLSFFPYFLVWRARVTMVTWHYTGQSRGGWNWAELAEEGYRSLWHQHCHMRAPAVHVLFCPSRDSTRRNHDVREQQEVLHRAPVSTSGWMWSHQTRLLMVFSSPLPVCQTTIYLQEESNPIIKFK